MTHMQVDRELLILGTYITGIIPHGINLSMCCDFNTDVIMFVFAAQLPNRFIDSYVGYPLSRFLDSPSDDKQIIAQTVIMQALTTINDRVAVRSDYYDPSFDFNAPLLSMRRYAF